jgi:hypothetical protein
VFGRPAAVGAAAFGVINGTHGRNHRTQWCACGGRASASCLLSSVGRTKTVTNNH